MLISIQLDEIRDTQNGNFHSPRQSFAKFYGFLHKLDVNCLIWKKKLFSVKSCKAKNFDAVLFVPSLASITLIIMMQKGFLIKMQHIFDLRVTLT